jgi:hypothetical protein
MVLAALPRQPTMEVTMNVLLPAGVAAALMVSSAAFAAGPATHYWPKNAATRALNLLEANGYGDFTNFHPMGHDYAATVSQNGQTFAVTINPETGQITRS